MEYLIEANRSTSVGVLQQNKSCTKALTKNIQKVSSEVWRYQDQKLWKIQVIRAERSNTESDERVQSPLIKAFSVGYVSCLRILDKSNQIPSSGAVIAPDLSRSTVENQFHNLHAQVARISGCHIMIHARWCLLWVCTWRRATGLGWRSKSAVSLWESAHPTPLIHLKQVDSKRTVDPP